jgi:2-C-methyl-D-erythritol 4-phosphate cytidylyltransferase/2-C-methyl-D-erythritol 2,4-cyclodiphosphate synthase
VRVVNGDPRNLKVTTPADLDTVRALLERAWSHRVTGTGRRHGSGSVRASTSIASRPLPGRPLVLGGVTIPGVAGLAGHSDADVVAHALADALLGAAGLGDLGRHFPDTDPAWAGADSLGAAGPGPHLVGPEAMRW